MASSQSPATGRTVRQRRSHVVSQAGLQAKDHYTDWAIAAVLFAISVVGNMGIFGANLTHFDELVYWRTSWPVVLVSLVLALLMQYWVQRRQWANCHEKWGWRYRTALAASVVPSCITYFPLVIPPAAAPIIARGAPLFVVYGLLGVLALAIIIGVDVAQEEILVGR